MTVTHRRAARGSVNEVRGSVCGVKTRVDVGRGVVEDVSMVAGDGRVGSSTAFDDGEGVWEEISAEGSTVIVVDGISILDIRNFVC